MKKLSLLMTILLVSSMMLFGCGKKEEVQEPEVIPPVEETEDDEEEDEIFSDGKTRSQLTNYVIDPALADKRPISIMINNAKEATPHTGVGEAGVMYEAVVEGSYTRLMGIFEDWEKIEKIGPVRSCRDYFVYWAYEWDSIYCHFGGPKLYVNEVLSRPETDNLDGITLDDGVVYYRTTDRVKPHNSYTSGPGLLTGAERREYSLTHTENYRENHFNFAREEEPNTLEGAPGVFDATRLEPGYLINKPYFEYNDEDGLYYRWQYGDKHTDVATGEQLAYTNVIFQNTHYEVRDAKGYLAFKNHDNTKSGYYFTNGKAIPIHWKKSSDFSPTTYYDEDYNEININTGKTMICIIQDELKEAVVIE